MFRIKVERTIDQPIDTVFSALSDHENYASFPMIDESDLLIQGEVCEDGKFNGNGALRKIRSGAFVVKERIYNVVKNERICYRIECARPIGMDHKIGRIELKTVENNSTHVVWVSEGKLKIPLLGRFLDMKMQENGTKVFHRMLKYIEEHGRLS